VDGTPEHADLERRQRFTDALLETIEVGIVGCDADSVFLVSNRAEREMFVFDTGLDGLRPEHLDRRIDVYSPGGEKLGPQDYPLMRALRGEDVSKVDVVAGPAGGPYKELVVRGRQITGPQGEVLGAVAALTDVTAERAIGRALADEHRRLAEAQRLGRLGSFECDFVTRTWAFSRHLLVLWGLPPDVAVERAVELIHPDDRDAALASWHAACRSGGPQSFEFRILHGTDRAERLLRCHVEVHLGDDGRPVLGRGIHQDITDLHVAERDARRGQAFLQAVLAATPDDIVVTDVVTGALVYGSARDVLGLGAEQLRALGAEGVAARTHPDDQARVRALDLSAAALPDDEVVSADYRSRHADGTWRWLSRRVTPFRRGADGRVVEVLAVVRDVTGVVEAEQRLRHAARHDHLTGLPNRAELVERLDATLVRAGRDGGEAAVLFCDLDGFKGVNDTSGHAAGDAVLVEISSRLLAEVREEDIVARVGGDEFVVVLQPWQAATQASGDGTCARLVPDRQAAVEVAQRLAAALRRPILVGDREHIVTVSIGLAFALDTAGTQDITSESLLRAADAAMYRAKSDGKDRLEIVQQRAAEKSSASFA